MRISGPAAKKLVWGSWWAQAMLYHHLLYLNFFVIAWLPSRLPCPEGPY